MLSAFGKAFKTPDLRKKIFFTPCNHGALPFWFNCSNTRSFIHQRSNLFKASELRWPIRID